METRKFHTIHCIPSPYRVHLFTELYRQLQEKNIEFHAHFMSTGAYGNGRPKSWLFPKMDFPYTYWPEFGPRAHYFNPSMLWNVRRMKLDWLLIASIYDTPTGILASWMCPAKTRITWCEGNTKTPGVFTGWKGALKKSVLPRYEYVAVPGVDGQRYIELAGRELKVKMPQPVFLPNLIDETRFRPRADWPQVEIDEIRGRFLKSADEKLCLIPARLDPEKGLLEMISLLDERMLAGWRIVILGQGALRQKILDLISEKNLSARFNVLDYIDYAEMPKFYAASDLFLLPSLKDPNPLSVIEALHSGLPVAVSFQTGNVEEAVTDGVNGWRLPVLEKDAFSVVLKEVFASSTEQLREMGLHSKRENAEFWNTKKSIANFLAGVGIEA